MALECWLQKIQLTTLQLFSSLPELVHRRLPDEVLFSSFLIHQPQVPRLLLIAVWQNPTRDPYHRWKRGLGEPTYFSNHGVHYLSYVHQSQGYYETHHAMNRP